MHMRLLVPIIFVSAAPLSGQTVAERMARADGQVAVEFPARPEVCIGPNGELEGLLSEGRPCSRGTVQLIATVEHGQPDGLQARVVNGRGVRDSTVLAVSATDARAWLVDIARHGTPIAARDAIVPLMLSDGGLPWHELVEIARDSAAPAEARAGALLWLGEGASYRIEPPSAPRDNEDPRIAAVLVLARQPHALALASLLELAEGAPDVSVRSTALYWLGLLGDARAVPVLSKALALAPQ